MINTMNSENNNELIVKYSRLIYYVIKQLGLLHDSDEYYEVGVIGLVKALRDFDESKGYKFSTFAYKYIRTEIIILLHYKNRYKRKINFLTVPLDEPLSENGFTYQEVIPSDVNIEEEVEQKILLEYVYKFIDMLDEKDSFIIKSYYGLQGYEQKNYQEIGKMLNLSKTAIRVRLLKNIQIIRKKIKSEIGDDYEKEN